MHLKTLVTLAVLSQLIACGESDKSPNPKPDASASEDAGKTVDASQTERDASEPPEDCDKLDTPGNDCPNAVGCREAIACGLETSSCCVPGFDVANVKCLDGLVCNAGAGRASCDGPEDCGGQACCVDITMGTTGCLPSCGTKAALCHKDADCESPKVCNPGGSFTWWGVCG